MSARTSAYAWSTSNPRGSGRCSTIRAATGAEDLRWPSVQALSSTATCDRRSRRGPTAAEPEFGPTLEIWEGWATDPEIRFRGSSGGMLSALSLYCLEAGGFAGVIHAGMDPAKPWMNRNHVSRITRGGAGADRVALRAVGAVRRARRRAGDGAADVFIGKPCDASAVSDAARTRSGIVQKVGLVLTFFCAGTPSTRGTLGPDESAGASIVAKSRSCTIAATAGPASSGS